jgi:hypothetical protein
MSATSFDAIESPDSNPNMTEPDRQATPSEAVSSKVLDFVSSDDLPTHILTLLQKTVMDDGTEHLNRMLEQNQLRLVLDLDQTLIDSSLESSLEPHVVASELNRGSSFKVDSPSETSLLVTVRFLLFVVWFSVRSVFYYQSRCTRVFGSAEPEL